MCRSENWLLMVERDAPENISAGNIFYGSIPSGTSATNTFIVQNTGGGTLTGTASVWAPYKILSGGTYNLGANQSQTVLVVFSPTAVGNYTQSVTLTGGGGASGRGRSRRDGLPS